MVTDEEVERYAKALWEGREDRRVKGMFIHKDDRRPWEAKNADDGCNRFEYNRDDFRDLVRGMLERLV